MPIKIQLIAPLLANKFVAMENLLFKVCLYINFFGGFLQVFARQKSETAGIFHNFHNFSPYFA